MYRVLLHQRLKRVQDIFTYYYVKISFTIDKKSTFLSQNLLSLEANQTKEYHYRSKLFQLSLSLVWVYIKWWCTYEHNYAGGWNGSQECSLQYKIEQHLLKVYPLSLTKSWYRHQVNTPWWDIRSQNLGRSKRASLCTDYLPPQANSSRTEHAQPKINWIKIN